MPILTITPANVVMTATGASASQGIAGETMTAGQAVYLKSTDGRYWLAQCDGTAEEGDCRGITLNGAAPGQPVTFCTSGTMNIGAVTIKTDAYVLSATPGGIAPQADLTAGNKIVYLGYAVDTAGAFVVHIVKTGATI